ncbi:PP2C family protein-serine/threonine phosphatase [Amycolatopsis sp. FDAARGOS 1241]|uniref:PP2C family protein-serine/threonine phosphatase n=1 Tax=Amycolatopsis sp. FDAARGOS 1241 TaxID=2778070 RepID=UPI00194F1B1A|nr:GAF domain-containing SpoIIE family protein phosphatase [Amycolatopsis sp. FDAARGOS 1241]QRP43386.1 SpoIIE family protein phosphatase [Amycolatopsis sp. FDAARGOS 1241]
MTGLGPVAAAVRRAFVDAGGRPVAVQVHDLGADGERFRGDGPIVVPDAKTLAELLPRQRVTGAVVVTDDHGTVLLHTDAPGGARLAATATGIAVAVAELAGTVSRLRAEAGVVDALHSVGRRLTAQLDLDGVVQDATDAATGATGAAFGAFFYNLIDKFGESYTLYTLSGVSREAFSRFPMPPNTAVFAPTFDGTGTVRSPDITGDPRFGHNAPHHGMPEGHLPVRSYLAVSVVSPTTGEVLGGFFFGHPETGRFTERHEYLAEGIAGYAAIALDNARLYERERTLAAELSRSMVRAVPEVPGLDLVTRYLPAATGTKVGGDWFDVLRLPSGATALVIGDVVGHGVTAATAMGQVRTAIRSYALLELPPGEVLRHVSQLTGSFAGPSFVTCFYAVHDRDTLVFANAGHLPGVLIHADSTAEQIGEALAQPLGVGVDFPQRQVDFPPGTGLVLYTDGLVESGPRDLTAGIERLLGALGGLRWAPDAGAAWDRLIHDLTGGVHDDDIALIHAHRHHGAVP